MFLCCQFEQTIEQPLDWTVIRDAMTVIWRRRNGDRICFFVRMYQTCCNWTEKDTLYLDIFIMESEKGTCYPDTLERNPIVVG